MLIEQAAKPIPKVLIVDDEETHRWIAETSLRQRGDVEVFTADCGENALPLIDAHDFDLIISDLNMPKGNGQWLLSQIKDKKHAPVMMISGQTIPCSTLREMGAYGALPKPHTKDQFLTVVDFIFGTL